MEKRYYTVETLEAELRSYEERYGMPSRDFYEKYVSCPVEGVSGFESSVWAAAYEDVLRLRRRKKPSSKRRRGHRAALRPAG